MTQMLSAMPTAVITESSENTISSSRICTMTPVNETRAFVLVAWPSSSSSFSCTSRTLFQIRNKPAEQQHQIAAGNSTVQDGQREQRLRQPHDPREAHQEQDSRDERERETELARLRLLFLRQLAGENRDEDDVVDAEHDLERREREEGNPDLRIAKPFHNSGER